MSAPTYKIPVMRVPVWCSRPDRPRPTSWFCSHDDCRERAIAAQARSLIPDYREEWRPANALPRGQYGPTADYGEG